MIVLIKGNVKFPITLDPSVWIFDDRKLLFDDLFDAEKLNAYEQTQEKKLEKQANAKVPPVNQNRINKNRKEILTNSYAMPLKEFLAHAEIDDDATHAILHTKFGDEKITLEQLNNCYLLFSNEGKQLKDDGPVHLYFKDGSNKDAPIKGIKQIFLQA